MGQQLHPAKIQSLPAEISSCQWGHVFCQAAVPSFSAMLSCQTVLLMDKLEDKWLKNKQKWEKNRKGLQKPTKSGRKQTKMWRITNYIPPSFPFLTCQAPISVP